MSDRLAEIKETKYSGKVLLDVHWLIQEVERLRGDAELLAYNVHDGDERV